MTPPAASPGPEPEAHGDDEWTFVKPRRSRRSNPPGRADTSSPAPPTPARRTGPPRPVRDIAAEYRALRAAWEPSPACRSLRALVAARAAAAAAPVTQAVCLGIGTFDPADGGWEARRRTYVQLIAFLVMVDELGAPPPPFPAHAAIKWGNADVTDDDAEKEAGARTVPCFFQEPVFTASDRAFIASLGHRVVDSPAGCERVDGATLLFGVHLYRPVYALALRNGPPAVFVGTGWDVWDR